MKLNIKKAESMLNEQLKRVHYWHDVNDETAQKCFSDLNAMILILETLGLKCNYVYSGLIVTKITIKDEK